MKMRTIKFTPKFLADALQGKATSLVSNLPKDVEILDIKFDLYNNQVLAVIRSDSFEDIAELCPIPEFKVTCISKVQTEPKTVPQPAFNVKVETRQATAAGSKPEPPTVKKTQVQPSSTATKMEGEFSPEQRKLLSFKMEGEYVIVKPTQFLKEEWEDINEVVRSLGGKWVKGDIISYWQIPLP